MPRVSHLRLLTAARTLYSHRAIGLERGTVARSELAYAHAVIRMPTREAAHMVPWTELAQAHRAGGLGGNKTLKLMRRLLLRLILTVPVPTA